MSRLYDRLLAHGSTSHPNGRQHVPFAEIQEGAKTRGLPECVVVDATNVADYWAAHHGGEMLSHKNLPTLVPPWEHFFLEYRFDIRGLPDHPLKAFILERAEPKRRAGGLLPNRVGVVGLGYDMLRDGDSIDDPIYDYDLRRWGGDREAVRFVMVLMVFWEFGKNHARGPLFNMTLPLYSDGSMLPGHDGKRAIIVRPLLDELQREEDADQLELLCMFGHWTVSPGLLAINFLHCRNVARLKHEPPAKPSLAFERKNGVPLTKYYTLAITPMTEVLEREGGASKVGLKRALHICRGHFATYSEDRPLFGKYAGTYWRPQHVRGSKEHGEIVKDYEVKGPTA